MSDRVKISVKSSNHVLHNLSSNPTARVTEFDNNLVTFAGTQMVNKFGSWLAFGLAIADFNEFYYRQER